MTIKITIGNAKGGVGKTLITSLIGYHLSEKGYKVLLVDIDPQGSLTQIMRKTYGEIEGNYMTLYEGLKAKKLKSAIVEGSENLHYIPSESDLTQLEYLLKKNPYTALKKQIDSFEGNYDFIFLDIPPSPDTPYSKIALGASDFFIPITTIESDSFRNIELFYNYGAMIQENYNPDLNFLGIIINLRDNDDDTFNKLNEEYTFSSDDFFKTIIPRRTRLFKYKEYGLYNFTKQKGGLRKLFNADGHDKEVKKIGDQLAGDILNRLSEIAK
jgi:chromosome partitioning protein